MFTIVMAGQEREARLQQDDPAIALIPKTWMPGTRPGMTT
jgi:hypothetical protein